MFASVANASTKANDESLLGVRMTVCQLHSFEEMNIVVEITNKYLFDPVQLMKQSLEGLPGDEATG